MGMQVFILDFDLHHGNGTADIFYDDPSGGLKSAGDPRDRENQGIVEGTKASLRIRRAFLF
jgi:acetoin utilization deacetylase AcuC-like enzyme